MDDPNEIVDDVLTILQNVVEIGSGDSKHSQSEAQKSGIFWLTYAIKKIENQFGR